MAKCFICGNPLRVEDEWRLNPKYPGGSLADGKSDQYGHKKCFIKVFEEHGVYHD